VCASGALALLLLSTSLACKGGGGCAPHSARWRPLVPRSRGKSRAPLGGRISMLVLCWLSTAAAACLPAASSQARAPARRWAQRTAAARASRMDGQRLAACALWLAALSGANWARQRQAAAAAWGGEPGRESICAQSLCCARPSWPPAWRRPAKARSFAAAAAAAANWESQRQTWAAGRSANGARLALGGGAGEPSGGRSRRRLCRPN